MPVEGVKLTEKSKLLSNEEIFYLSRLFVAQGVRKIRLTGGEPTVRKDIVEIIGNIILFIFCFVTTHVHQIKKKMIFDLIVPIMMTGNLKQIENLEQVGITTNGLMLTRLLVPMQRAGLDAINISLDTLNARKFETITRRKGFERVLAGIDLAIQLGYKPKINCVVMNDFNENEICEFVEMTKEKNIDVRFIEYMPFTGNKWETEKMITFR